MSVVGTGQVSVELHPDAVVRPETADVRRSAAGRAVFFGFLAVLAAVPLALTTLTTPEDLKWLILDTAAPALAVAFVVLQLFFGRPAFRHDAVTWALLATLAAQFISLRGAVNVGFGLLDIVKHVGLFSLYFLAANAPADDRDRDRVLWVVAATGLLVSLYGIAQHFGYDFFPWAEHEEVPTRRGVSTIGHGTFAASFLIIAIPLTVGLAASRRGWIGRVAAGSVVALMLVHLSFTGARGPALGLTVAAAATGIVIFVAGRRNDGRARLRLIGLGVGALVVLVVLAGVVVSAWREKGSDAMAVKEGGMALRVYTWETASRLFLRHWATGVGVGNYSLASPPLWNEEETLHFIEHQRFSGEVHNEYLEVAAEQGVVGLAAFLFLVTATWTGALRLARSATSPGGRYIGLALFAAVTAALVDALGIFNLQVAGPATLFWAALGLITYGASGLPRAGVESTGPESPPFP